MMIWVGGMRINPFPSLFQQSSQTENFLNDFVTFKMLSRATLRLQRCSAVVKAIRNFSGSSQVDDKFLISYMLQFCVQDFVINDSIAMHVNTVALICRFQHRQKVAVLGAAGGIGQPMSLLLKQSPGISHLALYDIVNTPGIYACSTN